MKTAISCPTFVAGGDSDLFDECDLKNDFETEMPIESTSKRKRVESEVR